MKQLKPIVRGGLCVAFFLFLPFWACKGQELDVSSPTYTGVIKPDYQDEVRLNYDYNSILDYQTYDQCLEKNNGLCVKSERAIQYLYITSTVVQFADNEDYFSITQNSRTFLEADGSRRIRIYGGQPFIKVEGQWYETGIERTSQATWDKAVSASLSQAKFDQWNPFKIYRLNAQTYYAGTGDGYSLNHSNVSYTTARGEATGDETSANSNPLSMFDGKNINNYWYDCRLFFPFDTSSLDGTIATASLFLYHLTDTNINGDGSAKELNVSDTTFNSGDLASENYNDITLNSATEFSDRVAISAIPDNAYYEFVLNQDGIDAIDVDGNTGFVIRSDDDFDDTSDNTLTQADFRPSDQTGTDYDPYLEVTMSGGEEPPAEATTTIGLLYPENMCINNDLSIICGMTQHYESTTTLPDWVEYHYYHIPFLVWIIIAAVTLWLGNRLLLEFLIRWRQ